MLVFLKKAPFVFVASLLAGFIPVASGLRSSLAIARTFSSKDAKQLSNSFQVWEELPPCDATELPSADLFLVFSQSLEHSKVARDAVKQVEQLFHETGGWGKCVNNVFSFGVNIDPSQDIYASKDQSTNALWVNGPNRQFERTVRELQRHGRGASYDFMYLMEMDSVPIQPFWLDRIQEEIANQPTDFAILGR